MRLLIVACVTLGLASCAHPINRHNAAKYHDWGLEAERAGDYRLAERNYERALINARLGHAQDAGLSMAMYNLGRVKAYLCKYDDAEKLLVDALQLEERVTGPDSGLTSMRLFELARLHLDRRQYAAALPYFARGIPVVKKLGVESSDPIALADALEQYSIALGKSGRSADSMQRKREADALRAGNPGRTARFRPPRYGQPCPAEARP